MDWVLQNPEIIRNIRSRLRKGRVLGGVILYLLLLFVIAYILFESSSHLSAEPEALAEYGKYLYFAILGIQYFVSLIIGAVICSNSIVSEREKNAYDFLRMLPIHPAKIVLGKLLGVPILVYLLMALTFPIALLCLLLGGVSPGTFLITHIILLFSGFFTHSMGLFFSALAVKSSWANAGTLLALFLLSIFLNAPPVNFLHPLHYFERTIRDKAFDSVFFFGGSVPEVLMTIAIYLFFTIWFFIGIYRSLEQEGYRLYTKPQSIIFYTLFSLLLLGLFWPHLGSLEDSGWLALTAFLSILLMILVGLIFILAPNYDDLTQWFHTHLTHKIAIWTDPLEDTKAIFPLLLFYNLIVVAIGTAMIWGVPLLSRWKSVAFCLVFFVLFATVYALLIQIMHTWWSPFSRNYLALGLMVIFGCLPLFGGEPPVYFFLNPFYILGYLAQDKPLLPLILFSMVLLVIMVVVLLLWYRSRLVLLQHKVRERRNDLGYIGK